MIYKQKLVLWQAEKGDRFQVVNADLTASQRSTHCITEIYALHHRDPRTASQRYTHCITEIYALHHRDLRTASQRYLSIWHCRRSTHYITLHHRNLRTASQRYMSIWHCRRSTHYIKGSFTQSITTEVRAKRTQWSHVYAAPTQRKVHTLHHIRKMH
jgi:AraC-like DNA-binding protein